VVGYRTTIATAIAIVFAAIALLLLPVVSYRVEIPADEGSPPARLELIFKGITPLAGHTARVSVSTKTGSGWEEQPDGEEALPIVVDAAPTARTFTILGLLLLVAGVLAAFLRRAQIRLLASAAGALLGGVALFVAALSMRHTLVDIGSQLSAGGVGGDGVGYRLGFWVSMLLLVVTAFGNMALAIMRSPAKAAPVEPQVPSTAGAEATESSTTESSTTEAGSGP
jgi:hypothetical protein